MGHLDTEIRRWIEVARGEVFDGARFALVDSEWRIDYEAFPRGGAPLEIRIQDVREILSLSYREAAGGGLVPMDPAEYALVDTAVWPQVQLTDPATGWPSVDLSGDAPIRLVVTAGAQTQAAVPVEWQAAITDRVRALTLGDGDSKIFDATVARFRCNYP